MQIKIKQLHPDAKIPTLSNYGDAGLDLCTIEPADINPGCRALLKTGLAMGLPHRTVGQIWPRSKLAAKYGLDVLAGIVDSSYTGEIMVSIINHGHEKVELKAGDKVAQMVVVEYHSDLPQIVVEELKTTDRGGAGINDSDLRIR